MHIIVKIEVKIFVVLRQLVASYYKLKFTMLGMPPVRYKMKIIVVHLYDIEHEIGT